MISTGTRDIGVLDLDVADMHLQELQEGHGVRVYTYGICGACLLCRGYMEVLYAER